MKQETATITKTAQTWVKKAVARLRHDAEHPPEFMPEFALGVNAYEAARLMQVVLDEIEVLVPVLDYEEHEFSDYWLIEKAATDLARQLKKRRLAEKLGNVEGRTPEEAETFAAKARELSG